LASGTVTPSRNERSKAQSWCCSLLHTVSFSLISLNIHNNKEPEGTEGIEAKTWKNLQKLGKTFKNFDKR
jgi:hypothetical protein